MKLKFMLVPLAVFGLVVGSYADCSKDEIMKFIDKGYSKTEINGICGKSEPKKKKSKWISPTQKVCKANGGKMAGYTCEASWSDAKDICSASGGRLATIDELKKVVTDCGGTIDDLDNNQADSVYQDCYKRKGFSTSRDYWSSTTYGRYANDAWCVGFNGGYMHYYGKPYNTHIRCVRAGQ
jgi:hypothetical protein